MPVTTPKKIILPIMQVCNLYIGLEEFAHMRQAVTQKLHQAGAYNAEPVVITLRREMKCGESWRRTMAMGRHHILNQ